MPYIRGRDGASAGNAPVSTISDEQWDALSRRRGKVFETPEEYEARGDASDTQKRKADES